MRLLNKLHNRRAPPGLEWTILKRLPMALLGSTLVPLFLALGTRIFPPAGTAAEIAKHITTVDIMAIALAVTAWTAAVTVAIGCVVVVVMKGPAYVADAYPLNDAGRPAEPLSDE